MFKKISTFMLVIALSVFTAITVFADDEGEESSIDYGWGDEDSQYWGDRISHKEESSTATPEPTQEESTAPIVEEESVIIEEEPVVEEKPPLEAWCPASYTRGCGEGFTVTINDEVEIYKAYFHGMGLFASTYFVSYADGYTYVYFTPHEMDNLLHPTIEVGSDYFNYSFDTSRGGVTVYWTMYDGNYYSDELWRGYLSEEELEKRDAIDRTPGKWILGEDGSYELNPEYVQNHPEEFANDEDENSSTPTASGQTPSGSNGESNGSTEENSDKTDDNDKSADGDSKPTASRTYSYPPAPTSVKSGDTVVPYHEKTSEDSTPAESDVSSDTAEDTTTVEPEQDAKEDAIVTTDSAPTYGKLILPVAGGVIGVAAVTFIILFFAKKKKKDKKNEEQ